MIGLTLVEPYTISNISAPGNDAQLLLTPDPKEVWQRGGNATTAIEIDLGEERSVDAVFIGFATLSAQSQVQVIKTTAFGSGTTTLVSANRPFRAPGGKGPAYHHFVRFDQPATLRYMRIIISTGNTGPDLQAGVMMVGRALVYPYEFRSGRRPIDMSGRTSTKSGGFGIDVGATKSAFRCTVAGLSDNDVDDLYELAMLAGESIPVLAVEGHQGTPTHRQLHYGLFDQFEPYEREAPQDTRWGLAFEDWI